MNAPVLIIDILGRSTQGVTRPFICRGEDGSLYWVKGAAAGRRALCREWVAGRLAERLGLPIPRFAQVSVPEELALVSTMADISDLGAGLAFGSSDVSGVQEFNCAHVRRVAAELQQRILLFDWWVCNLDRTLSECGGNPNVLWEVEHGRPWIIDHNLSFDPEFSLRPFFETHVFASARAAASSLALADERERMCRLLPEVDQICLELPQEWLYLDNDLGAPVDFSSEAVRRILTKVETDFGNEWGRGT